MSSHSLTLDYFIESVPIGEPTANLETALKIFQSVESEAIAIVNPEGLPLGIVRCRSILTHLAQHIQALAREHIDVSIINIQLKTFIEPVKILPARMKVGELWSYLNEERQASLHKTPHALVDSQGKFLGLLDRQKLLKAILPAVQKKRVKSQSQLPTLHEELLFQFLEQLSLPMMLSASHGEILYRNSSWKKQIGEFFPTDEGSFCPLALEAMKISGARMRQAAAIASGSTHQLEPSPQSQPIANHSFPRQLDDIPEQFTNSEVTAFSEQLKTLGDRAWQFVKFSLTLNPYFPLASPDSPFWLVIATDVTEQQRLCKELAAKNADLAQLNRLKDEFLACISHELKSPLTAVLGLSSLLQEQKLGELNQRQVHYAQLIHQSGRQLMTLVNDLLDLTRLETGQLKLNPASLQIKTVCEQAYRIVEEKYKEKTESPISYHLEIESGLDSIIADELRIRQILVHLLDNALKFTPDGKPFGLKVNRWEHWIAFTVWDSGIGIPEEYQHLIFQKFQQLESPLTRQFEGTGLGLFLTQRLAKAHGGDISFISKVGQGSQFTLLLPPTPTPLSQRIGKENKQKRPPLALVVEALPRAIDNLTEKLMRLGYRVAIARTGTEALEKARQLQPQTIFLNPSLPLLSGWDVLTLLRADKKTKNIRVIITAPPADKLRAQQYGVNDFLPLPVEQEPLQAYLLEQELRASSQPKSLTILCLHPEPRQNTSEINASLSLSLINQLSQFNHRILEADDLEQAEILARVWNIDAIVLNSTISTAPHDYLRSLAEQESLAALPLVTLDTETTEAANQIDNLAVFPCLVPAEQNNDERLLQVIQIAAGMKKGSRL
jgi:signal transduction histidine kinase/ActR/RegA family two-component response regulator